jgi:hypothetical protein
MNYFLVSTPLQYCNARNIEVEGKKTLVFLGDFHGALEFYERIGDSVYWDEKIWFGAYRKLLSFLKDVINKSDRLFIDSDYGLQTNWMLSKIKTNQIYVYEEGTGSYRNDLLSARCKSKSLYRLLKFLGNKEHFGDSKFVRGIYLYDIPKHNLSVPDFKNQRFSFRKPFVDNLNEICREILTADERKKYQEMVAGKSIYLYLTNWNYNKKIERIFQNRKNLNEGNTLFILKPHPRIKECSSDFEFDLVLSSGVMVEMILQTFQDFAKELFVYHDGSSALLYLTDINNTIIDAV